MEILIFIIIVLCMLLIANGIHKRLDAIDELLMHRQKELQQLKDIAVQIRINFDQTQPQQEDSTVIEQEFFEDGVKSNKSESQFNVLRCCFEKYKNKTDRKLIIGINDYINSFAESMIAEYDKLNQAVFFLQSKLFTYLEKISESLLCVNNSTKDHVNKEFSYLKKSISEIYFQGQRNCKTLQDNAFLLDEMTMMITSFTKSNNLRPIFEALQTMENKLLNLINLNNMADILDSYNYSGNGKVIEKKAENPSSSLYSYITNIEREEKVNPAIDEVFLELFDELESKNFDYAELIEKDGGTFGGEAKISGTNGTIEVICRELETLETMCNDLVCNMQIKLEESSTLNLDSDMLKDEE